MKKITLITFLSLSCLLSQAQYSFTGLTENDVTQILQSESDFKVIFKNGSEVQVDGFEIKIASLTDLDGDGVNELGIQSYGESLWGMYYIFKFDLKSQKWQYFCNPYTIYRPSAQPPIVENGKVFIIFQDIDNNDVLASFKKQIVKK